MDNIKENSDRKKFTNINLQSFHRLAAYYMSIFGLVLCGLVIATATTIKSIWKTVWTRKKDISKEIVLITGGGSGLGRQIALELARYKPKKIILWGRNTQTLSDTCNDILSLGVACVYMVCDVGIKSKIDQQSEIVQQEHGPVTILINNAGVVAPGRILELKDDDIETIFRVNILAQLRTLRAFIPSMQNNKHGHIVTIGSCLGLMGINQTCAYASSKFGLTAYAESLSYIINKETYPGINTTVIYPFQINNNMFAGCTSRFPWMFPPVDEKFTAMKTVKAILTNTTAVIIPQYICIIYALHMLLPFSVDFLIGEFCGMSTAMESFQGHGIKPKSKELQTKIEENENS